MVRTRPLVVAVTILALVLSVTGCATGRSEAAFYAEKELAEAPAFADAGASLEAAPRSAAPASDRSNAIVAGEATPMAQNESQRPPGARLRVYSAELTLSVARVGEAREAVIEVAEDLGGYVEASGEALVTIRVPAESFQRALLSVEALGRVEARSVGTVDVTDQFADLERRLEISESSRTRLVELLERAEEAEQRVAILREIRRLTEEIETLRAAISSLGELVRYSRISVSLRARLAGAATPTIPFHWIAELDPVYRTTGRARGPVSIDVGEDFAVFETGREFRAESADGVRIRIGSVDNEPRGDTVFWAQALRFHLAARYADVETASAGPLEGALFIGSGFRYLVLVGVRDREVIVAEAFLPDAAEDRIDAVFSALQEVEL